VTTVRGFGVTSVEDPLPVTAHTVFPIASISKTFAATAMMRLVEQGKVDLRAPGPVVPARLPRAEDEAVSREVTIWHLLTHSSGWEGQVSGPDRGEETLKNFVSTIGGLMQLAPPGAAWSYNKRRLQRRRARHRNGHRHVRSTRRFATWCSSRSGWRTPARPPATSSPIASPSAT
jgi:CubicO group peptidase (beta-lactamase class C family)